jgi:ABC-type oligopeptide transport system substrate-binding subunit
MMKKLMSGLTLVAVAALFAAGCGPSSTDTSKKSENKKPTPEKLAQLDESHR